MTLLKSEALLLLTAVIWGFAFVAQRVGMEFVEPFTFNAVRFALGSLALVPLILIRRRRSGHSPPAEGSPDGDSAAAGGSPVGDSAAAGSQDPASFADSSGHDSAASRGLDSGSLLFSGIIAGAILFAGASFQQIGIVYTTAGKAGFITGLYIIIVPVFGLFRKRKPGLSIWLGAVIALAGLHLLSFSGRFSIGHGDLLVLISAFFWAAHVTVIGIFSPRMDSYKLASVQFAVCSILSFGGALLTEEPAVAGIAAATIPILYAGLLSSGVAYTLQVVAQKRVKPANAAIIMSLEAVFAALGGWIALGESFSVKGIAGCGLMLTGMLISQLDRRRWTNG